MGVNEVDRAAGGGRNRLREERVAGDVEEVDTLQPGLVEIIRPETVGGALLASEGPLAGAADENHDGPGRLVAGNGTDLDAGGLDLVDDAAPGGVVADAGDEPGLFAERHGPGAEVRGLAPAGKRDGGVLVVVETQLSLRGDGHVEDE